MQPLERCKNFENKEREKRMNKRREILAFIPLGEILSHSKGEKKDDG